MTLALTQNVFANGTHAPELARIVPRAAKRLEALESRLASVLQGKPEVIRFAMVTLLAKGHLLLEDVPGVGKTTLALALASALGCTFSRIQFTSDLLPSDIIGTSLFHQQRSVFEFRPGPLFHHIVLADELNRTTPKTQSCLLEAMSEGKASVDGVTHSLPEPFMVLATQNPIEHHGTFPLPESQLDRFMMRLKVGYPEHEAERQILRGVSRPLPGTDPAVLSPHEVLELQSLVPSIAVAVELEDYLLNIVQASRTSSRLALGVSPRGAQQLYRAAQAKALLNGRAYVIPDDIKLLAVPVLAHRIVPFEHVGLVVPAEDARALMEELLGRIPVPG